jgi:hypothetical protein
MSRPFLGISALGFLITGLVATFVVDPAPDELIWGGVLLRAGMLMGAWWLVLPSARRLRPQTWWAIAIVGVVLVLRPRLVLWGLLAALVVILSGWGRSRRANGTGRSR